MSHKVQGSGFLSLQTWNCSLMMKSSSPLVTVARATAKKVRKMSCIFVSGWLWSELCNDGDICENHQVKYRTGSQRQQNVCRRFQFWRRFTFNLLPNSQTYVQKAVYLMAPPTIRGIALSLWRVLCLCLLALLSVSNWGNLTTTHKFVQVTSVPHLSVRWRPPVTSLVCSRITWLGGYQYHKLEIRKISGGESHCSVNTKFDFPTSSCWKLAKKKNKQARVGSILGGNLVGRWVDISWKIRMKTYTVVLANPSQCLKFLTPSFPTLCDPSLSKNFHPIRKMCALSGATMSRSRASPKNKMIIFSKICFLISRTSVSSHPLTWWMGQTKLTTLAWIFHLFIHTTNNIKICNMWTNDQENNQGVVLPCRTEGKWLMVPWYNRPVLQQLHF